MHSTHTLAHTLFLSCSCDCSIYIGSPCERCDSVLRVILPAPDHRPRLGVKGNLIVFEYKWNTFFSRNMQHKACACVGHQSADNRWPHVTQHTIYTNAHNGTHTIAPAFLSSTTWFFIFYAFGVAMHIYWEKRLLHNYAGFEFLGFIDSGFIECIILLVMSASNSIKSCITLAELSKWLRIFQISPTHHTQKTCSIPSELYTILLENPESVSRSTAYS